MSDTGDHHCPGCGTPRKHVARYPWHFCNDCRDSACNTEGRQLIFGNGGVSGGFVWGFADEEERFETGSIIALIKGRPVVVGEARFGGTVAQPYLGPLHRLIDVRKPDFDRSALRPVPGSRGRGRG